MRYRLVIALSLILAVVALWYCHGLILERKAAQERQGIAAWISDEELSRLMRYHGVTMASISEDTVEIERDGKWIVVLRREK